MEAVERYHAWRREQVSRVFDEASTAREAIGRLLELAATEFSKPGAPGGCMVVMSATNCSEACVQTSLAERRAKSRANMKARIDRGVTDGDLPPDTDTTALADFYATVLEGMAFRSRDGASRKTLLAIAQNAMRAWPASQPARRPARARDTA
jgi:hypothetical protein